MVLQYNGSKLNFYNSIRFYLLLIKKSLCIKLDQLQDKKEEEKTVGLNIKKKLFLQTLLDPY